jgi:hypothetical protein
MSRSTRIDTMSASRSASRLRAAGGRPVGRGRDQALLDQILDGLLVPA